MSLQCRVFRGLVMEVQEEINQFLSGNQVRVVHMAQSETADHITVTLMVEPIAAAPDPK